MQRRNLQFLGPFFKTFVSRRCSGTPDIVLANQSFNIFNHLIEQGKDIGSDHLPIVMRIQVQPFIIVGEPRPNINTLNISNYMRDLRELEVIDLENKPTEYLDNQTNKLISSIQTATEKNSNPHKLIKIQQYSPTPEIINSIQEYQKLISNYYRSGNPPYYKASNQLEHTLNLIKEHSSAIWKNLVKLASECHGDPPKFWKKFKKLMGGKTISTHFLYKIINNQIAPNNTNNNNANQSVKITDPQEQADLMSSIWSDTFKDHEDPKFDNPNTRKVDAWFHEKINLFQPSNIIKINSLPSNHPLRRPIKINELNNAILNSRDKAPGPSSLTLKQFKYLPTNCKTIMINIYNGIISTNYFPKFSRKMTLIFINKPGKSPHDPHHYRPICLLQYFIRFFDKLIAQRLLHYLEHHNILNENQFGFRAGRSCSQVVDLVDIAIDAHRSNKKAVLACTRDYSKAFDKVNFHCLLYKLHEYVIEDDSFAALIYQFLISREITPVFNNHTGTIIRPSAGVPQGSALGPILFLIYVNDVPKPIYEDTILTQYADDLLHICVSYGKAPKSKTRQVRDKMEKELEKTRKWEEKWKLECNVSKTCITPFGISTASLEKINGVKLNNTKLTIKPSTKILGYNLNKSKFKSLHVNKLISKAKVSLNKLYRFSSAPPKVKLIFIKTLVRPLLEFPISQLTNIGKGNKSKMQKIQNRALRFVKNLKLSDRKRSKDLHEELKMTPLNVRINKLANKSANKMKALFHYEEGHHPLPSYKYDTDYEINEDPHLSKIAITFTKNR